MRMKPQMQSLQAYVPELPQEMVMTKYGLTNLHRFSANENVFGPSPKVAEAMKQVETSDLNYYPDGNATTLRNAVAALHQIEPTKLVFGAGLDEIIQLLTRVLLEKGKNLVTIAPTFSEYELHATIEGATTKKIAVLPDGHIDFAGVLDAIDADTNLIVITNPNNPTGVFEEFETMTHFIEQVPVDVPVFVDEAYIEFIVAESASVMPLTKKYPNLIVGRTLSKAYGLANIRIGYEVMSDPILTAMQAVRLPYNLSTQQLAGATAAIIDQDHLENYVTSIQVERQRWLDWLADNDFEFFQSSTNFIFVKVGQAKRVGEYLLSRGFQVNDRLNDEWIRFSIGLPADNEMLREQLSRSPLV